MSLLPKTTAFRVGLTFVAIFSMVVGTVVLLHLALVGSAIAREVTKSDPSADIRQN